MSDPLSSVPVTTTVEARAHGWRIDHYLARTYSNYTRALLQKSIEQGGVLVNGLPTKASKKLRMNDIVSARLPELPDRSLPAEDLPLNILFEDDVMIVLNKAPGMIVHPGRGNYHGTLAGALQFHFNQLSDLAGQMRPGIVHRLDRDTSGLLVVAKTNQIHHALSSQFEKREVTKEYRAIVHGVLDRDSDWIETYLQIDPKARERICVCPPGGNARDAVTFYEVLERFERYTYVRLLPKTGRTHQLRVHMRHLGHPIVADRVYGGRIPLEFGGLAAVSAVEISASVTEASQPVPGADTPREESIVSPTETELLDETGDAALLEPDELESPIAASSGACITRQALHAHRLEITHPISRNRLEFIAPLPDDMQRLLLLLQEQQRARA